MEKNQCERCLQIFPDESHLLQHQKRKTLCEKNKFKSVKQKPYKCKICNKKYTRPFSLNRHLNTRKHFKNVEWVKNGGKKKETKKQITSSNQISINNATGNINHITNINHVNINYVTNADGYKDHYNPMNDNIDGNIIEFSTENLSDLVPAEQLKIALSPCPIVGLLDVFYFTKDKPERRNVYFNRNGQGMVYENDEWIPRETNYILNQLCDTKSKLLEDLIETLWGVTTGSTRHRLYNSVSCIDRNDGNGGEDLKQVRNFMRAYSAKIIVRPGNHRK